MSQPPSDQPKPENQINTEQPVSNCSIASTVYSISHMLMTFAAVYLSHRCNNGKFEPGPFLMALFFPYIYIIYSIATKGTCSK